MTEEELILEWARLLLQGQVLAAVLVAVGMFVWREPIRELIHAIAERGFRFTTGSFAGELAAGAGEGAMPVAESSRVGGEAVAESEQSSRLKELALQLTDVIRDGPSARSAFVRQIRREHGTGWSWAFLERMLGHQRMTMRFCAASLLVSIQMKPSRVAQLLSRESSSLVRFRLVEALRHWASSPGATEEEHQAVLALLREYTEENAYVRRSLSRLKSALSQ